METRDPTQFLIEKAQNGDRGALGTLVSRYLPRLRALIDSRLGAHLRSSTSVEDLLQDVLLLAVGSIDRFRWGSDDAFLRWLGGIAENAIRNAARRQHRGRKLRLDPQRSEPAPPSKNLRREERFDRLRGAIGQLCEPQRRALLLARIDGLRIREVARRMGRSETAVRNLILRALRKLRSVLADTESLHLPGWSLGAEDDPWAGGAPTDPNP